MAASSNEPLNHSQAFITAVKCYQDLSRRSVLQTLQMFDDTVLPAWWTFATLEARALRRQAILQKLLGDVESFPVNATDRRRFCTRWSMCVMAILRSLLEKSPSTLLPQWQQRGEQICELAMQFCPLQAAACRALLLRSAQVPAGGSESRPTARATMRQLASVAESVTAQKHSAYRITRQDFEPQDAWDHVARSVELSLKKGVTSSASFAPSLARRLLCSDVGRSWLTYPAGSVMICERAVYTACALLGSSHFPTFYSFLPLLFDVLRFVQCSPAPHLNTLLRQATLRFLDHQSSIVLSLRETFDSNKQTNEHSSSKPSEALLRFLAEILEPLIRVTDRCMQKQVTNIGEVRLRQLIFSSAITSFNKMNKDRKGRKQFGIDCVFLENYVATHEALDHAERVRLHAQLCRLR